MDPRAAKLRKTSMTSTMTTSASASSGASQPAVDAVLTELHLAEYIDKFSAEGFESWNDLMDATETDLIMLGVKPGHRRRIQRRIATDRGVPEDQEIIYTAKPPERIRGAGADGQKKRRYRRHPKRDVNAPKPPLTAYAQFANDRRESLRNSNLSFADLAIEIGKQWRTINKIESLHYKSQALAAKEAFRKDSAAYSGTKEYREYQEYLKGWKGREKARIRQSGDYEDFEVASASASSPRDSFSNQQQPGQQQRPQQQQQRSRGKGRGMVDGEVDGMDGEVDGEADGVDEIDGEIDSLDGHVDGVDGQIDGIDSEEDSDDDQDGFPTPQPPYIPMQPPHPHHKPLTTRPSPPAATLNANVHNVNVNDNVPIPSTTSISSTPLPPTDKTRAYVDYRGVIQRGTGAGVGIGNGNGLGIGLGLGSSGIGGGGGGGGGEGEGAGTGGQLQTPGRSGSEFRFTRLPPGSREGRGTQGRGLGLGLGRGRGSGSGRG